MTFKEIKEKLKTKTVAIAGAGGLGSNCAVALARVGIGKIIIADFDVVSESNLNRQYFFYDQIGQKKSKAIEANLNRINPAVTVEAHDVKLDPETIIKLFSEADVIVEAFDLAEMKQMIAEVVMENFHEIPLVMGLGMAGWGNSNNIHMKHYGNIYICGDEISEIAPDLPPLGPRVGIVSNMQANTVLEILLK